MGFLGVYNPQGESESHASFAVYQHICPQAREVEDVEFVIDGLAKYGTLSHKVTQNDSNEGKSALWHTMTTCVIVEMLLRKSIDTPTPFRWSSILPGGLGGGMHALLLYPDETFADTATPQYNKRTASSTSPTPILQAPKKSRTH